MSSLIEVKELKKEYRMGEVAVPALAGVSLTIEKGEFVAVMGPSGSGKSTFMNIIGCMDQPTSGEYLLEGMSVSRLSRSDLARIRNQKIGFIFQGFNLLSRAKARENVELPMIYSGVPADEMRRRARDSLSLVGLGGREEHTPFQLSGGEQQRVAIARALVNHPSLILADEPTGNLDTATSHEIMVLLKKLNSENSLSIVLVTHEADIAAFASRVVRFRDGKLAP